METIEYRCVLVRPRSRVVLAFVDAGRFHLPRVHIPRATRTAREIQKAIRSKWGLDIFVLETWVAPDSIGGAYAIARLLTPEMASSLIDVPVEQFTASELIEADCRRLYLLFEIRPNSPLSELGWIDEAIVWMEAATGCTFASSRNLEQWNVGGGFALFRARADNGQHYWFKATGKPNTHEFVITRLLCQLCPEFLPKLVAIREEWNAWLTEHAGDPLADAPSEHELVSAASCMARLQFHTIGRTEELFAAGAVDQRVPVLRRHIDTVIDYLIGAMARQTSTKASPLSRDRLMELGQILRDVCFRLEALPIPDGLIHNDLNSGNILSDDANLVFTDWSEAAVGNPFLSCERLCQLNRAHAESARNVYRDHWSLRLSAETIDEAIVLTPLLAIYAYLYGRGDWLGQTVVLRPQFASYARSLARHMDRAAKDSSLLELLCH